MTSVFSEMPDNRQERKLWLEKLFVSGGKLGQFAEELEQLADSRRSHISLDQILEDKKDTVLEQGLTALSDKQLILLMQHPEQILPLQELVLTEGGNYWNKVAQESLTPEDKKRQQEQFAALMAKIKKSHPRSETEFDNGMGAKGREE